MDNVIKVIHLIPALGAALLGAYILVLRKGTTAHRMAGKVWAYAMLFVAVSGLFITGGPLAIYNGYGYIHILSVITISSISLGLWAIAHHKYRIHAASMIFTYSGLIIAGIFALMMPGRILHRLVFE